MEINEYLNYKQQENKLHTYVLKLEGLTPTEGSSYPVVNLSISGPDLYHPFENGSKVFNGLTLVYNGQSVSLNQISNFGSSYNSSSLWCNWASILRKCFKDARYHISAEYIPDPENEDNINSTFFTYSLRYTGQVYEFDTFGMIIPAIDSESSNPNGNIKVLNLLDFMITEIYVDDQLLWCDSSVPEE